MSLCQEARPRHRRITGRSRGSARRGDHRRTLPGPRGGTDAADTWGADLDGFPHQEGDQSAWNALVDRFLPLVTAVVRRFRLSSADADDVNQTVWLRLVEHLDEIREPRAVPGWLVTTTRNEALRVIKRRARDVTLDPHGRTLGLLHEVNDMDEGMMRTERSQALRDALLKLSPARRELLTLLLADPPLSYDEISSRLGIPIGSIGPTRARALEQLRNTDAMRALMASATQASEASRRWSR